MNLPRHRGPSRRVLRVRYHDGKWRKHAMVRRWFECGHSRVDRASWCGITRGYCGECAK